MKVTSILIEYKAIDNHTNNPIKTDEITNQLMFPLAKKELILPLIILFTKTVIPLNLQLTKEQK